MIGEGVYVCSGGSSWVAIGRGFSGIFWVGWFVEGAPKHEEEEPSSEGGALFEEYCDGVGKI